MPIHYNVDRFELVEEIDRIEKAGYVITFILPELINHNPGNMFGTITRYIIIFKENGQHK